VVRSRAKIPTPLRSTCSRVSLRAGSSNAIEPDFSSVSPLLPSITNLRCQSTTDSLPASDSVISRSGISVSSASGRRRVSGPTRATRSRSRPSSETLKFDTSACLPLTLADTAAPLPRCRWTCTAVMRTVSLKASRLAPSSAGRPISVTDASVNVASSRSLRSKSRMRSAPSRGELLPATVSASQLQNGFSMPIPHVRTMSV
jgi:hypothetical protein